MSHFVDRLRSVLILILTFAAYSYLEGAIFRSQPLNYTLSSGEILSVWQVNDSSGPMYIEGNVFNPSTGWGTSSVISLSGQKALAPGVCVDNFGNAIVVYLGIDPTTFNKYGYVAVFAGGYGWVPAVQIPSGSSVVYQSSQPMDQIAVINTSTGSTFVGVWCGFDTTTNSVHIYSTTATFSTTTGWGTMTTAVQVSP